jgi:hypothetical protein
MNALNVIGKVLDQNLEKLHVQTKKHLGDFSCEEFEEFRTFYMTCICGWRTPVKIMEGGFRSYYLHNLWEAHVGAEGQGTRIARR